MRKAPAKQSQHFNATYRTNVGCNILRAFGHAVATCCEMLGDVSLNLKMVKFFMQHCLCCMMLWSSGQVRATILRLGKRTISIFNSQQQGGQTRATCCARQCCDLLRWNVAIVWPELANAGPTMLGYVVLICCDRFGRDLMHLWREHLNGFEWCGCLVRLSLCV